MVKPIRTTNRTPILAGLSIVIILAGVVTGNVLANKKLTANVGKTNTDNVKVTQDEAGAKDASSFKDTATGTLEAGGIKGEGAFHLNRPGGADKTVYLTSTIIDMSPYVGKKVQVWGQTLSSKYAPWFMDVGRLKVVQ